MYLSTENILAILPMARILFLITSFRAAAALAVGGHMISDYIATGKVI